MDQTEQLATITSRAEREEFLAVLGSGMGPRSPVTTVMTVRSDRFDQMQRLPTVGSLIRAPFVLTPISRSRLATVIEGPARRADLIFAPGLVGRLIDDAVRGSHGEAADALPFLAFTLREMYDLLAAQERLTFTEDDYEQVGRIEGAITRRTEAAESLLPPDSDSILGQLLPRFIALSEDRPPTGRPVRRDRLTATEQEIVAKLEDQRLLTGTNDAVRLAHEQLITAWPRLASAVADRRDDLLLQTRIERQAQDWKHGNGELLGRDAASAASSWLQRAGSGASQSVVGEYIQAAQRALRRQRARAISLLCLIVTLALTASGVAVVAVIKGSDAIDQSHLAQSEAMAASATSLFPANTPLAMLLSLASYERDHTTQAGSALIQAAGQPLADLLTDGHPVADVVFSPNGQTLAAADSAGNITLWNVATGRRTATLAAGSAVYSVAFSPNGQTVTAGDLDGPLRLWDVATGRPTGTLVDGDSYDGDYSVSFSPNGRTLAVGDASGDIGLWDIATGRQTVTLSEGSGIVAGVGFSPNGRTLAAGDASGDIGLWNVATGNRTATLAEGSPVDSVAFSPNGQALAAGGDAGGIVLWNVATGRRTSALTEGSGVNSVAFSPNGRALAAGDASGDIGLWNVATGNRTATLAEGSPVDSVAFSPNGQTLAAGDLAGGVRVWNVATGQPAATLSLGNGSAYGVAFSPNRQTLAVGDNTGEITLWNLSTGQLTVLAEGNAVNSIAFSPNGQTLAVGDNAGDVILWLPATRQLVAVLADASPVNSVAFSPSGQTLAVGDNAGEVTLWDLATRRRIAILAGGSSVGSVAFSPNGQVIVAGEDDGNVGIWNADNEQLFGLLAEGNGGSPVNSIVFSPNGQVLAAGNANGDIALIRQNLSKLGQSSFERLICSKVRENMTHDQWTKYAPGQPYRKTCPSYP